MYIQYVFIKSPCIPVIRHLDQDNLEEKVSSFGDCSFRGLELMFIMAGNMAAGWQVSPGAVAKRSDHELQLWN